MYVLQAPRGGMQVPSQAVETTSPSEDRSRDIFGLASLSIALAYAAVEYGGVALDTWNACLLIVGIAAIVYWRRQPAAKLPSNPLWRWALLLFPAYIAFQLLPLPLPLVRILSPARAQALDRLAHLTRPVWFAPLSIVPATTFPYLLRTLAYVSAFLLVCQIARRRRWLAILPPIAIAVPEAAIGLWQNANQAAVQGTYVNKNHFAGLLEMVLPLTVAYAVALFEGRWRFVKTAAGLGAALLILGALVDSQSRMGFAAGLAGLAVMGALAIRARLGSWKRWLALGGMAVLVLFLLVFLPTDATIARLGGMFSNGSATGEARWSIWRDTLRLMAAYPAFGCGLGTYETAFLKYQTSVVDAAFTFAHNDYLQLTAELGIVGAAILAAFLLPIFARAFRASTSHDRHTRALGLGCAGAMTAIGLHSLADFNMYIPANALLFAWILGIAASLRLHSHGIPHARFRRYALGLGCLLAFYAPLAMLFHAAFRSDLGAERLFCHIGLCDTGQIVTAQALAHGGEVASVAPGVLLEALRRDANSPNRWCDAGAALWKSGRLAQAQECYGNALSLGPDLPTVLLRAADFYDAEGRQAGAVALTARVLAKTASYDSMVFEWYRTHKVPLSAVLSQGLTGNARAARAYLHNLMDNERMADAAETWQWVLSKGYADAALARDYSQYLFANEKYEAAALSWAAYLGPHREGYGESTWVFNGGFESELSGSPFGWRIDERQGVEAARDATVAHAGTHSLRIHFDGKENPDYGQIAQTVFLKPGKYRLTAFLKTQDLTTDQGIALRIVDPRAPPRLDVKTEPVSGTHDWTEVSQIFTVAPQTRTIWIQVIRRPSLRFDCNINGTAWIDSVSLARL